jgi:hypothetical protein
LLQIIDNRKLEAPMAVNALRIERDEMISSEPQTGGIYRDSTNRSLIVLRVRPSGVFVEYADGTTRSVSKSVWSRMMARPALC